ncbi:hypothetical protein D910_10666 [Dendroctonus ponderosae]|uniref:Uncharacterized protein n=1 Tax=Dendroctonus ponderosae TaxID=77166 RepID=U4UHC9_DENPD|nr:hypothetical protein D910_10666 [Dendroctonus ponderosae]
MWTYQACICPKIRSCVGKWPWASIRRYHDGGDRNDSRARGCAQQPHLDHRRSTFHRANRPKALEDRSEAGKCLSVWLSMSRLPSNRRILQSK